MTKSTRDIIQKMQEGKGGEIAKMFFLDYLMPSMITQIFYRKAWEMRDKQNSFVMPVIQNYLSEWKKLGFIEGLKIKIPIRKKGIKPYEIDGVGYRLNLEPFFIYCWIKYPEKYNPENKDLFTKEEKEFINLLLNPHSQRVLVYKEYPREELFNAILKFYIKHYVIPYGNLYKIKHFTENSTKIINKEEVKLLEGSEQNAERIIKIIKRSPDKFLKEIKKIEEISEDRKLLYIMKFKKNPQFVHNIDKKFMKVLGILP